VVVEEADVGRNQDPQPAVLRVERDMRSDLLGTQFAELVLQDGARPSERISLADLHGAQDSAASLAVGDLDRFR